jgi:hypothetical protein
VACVLSWKASARIWRNRIPPQANIEEVLIAEEVVTRKGQPRLVYQKTAETV